VDEAEWTYEVMGLIHFTIRARIVSSVLVLVERCCRFWTVSLVPTGENIVNYRGDRRKRIPV